MADSAAECDLESDTSSVDGFKCGSNEQTVRRLESLQQENRVLKTEVEALKLKIKGLNELNQQLRRNSVIIQAKAEQEEEYISNTLLKKITELKKEKESLALNYEQEEECLTNELNRKFTQLRQEKSALERTLAREQEDQVNKLKSRIEKLENDMNHKQTCLDRLRREKIELENALEQEQEALVNRLWKKMEKLEAEKRMLQEKLESLGSLISGSSSNQSLANISQQPATTSENGTTGGSVAGAQSRTSMDIAAGSGGAIAPTGSSNHSSRGSLHIQLPSPQPPGSISQLANSNSVLLNQSLPLATQSVPAIPSGPAMTQSLLLESSTLSEMRDVATSRSMNIVLPQSPMDLDVDHNASGSTSPICGVPNKKIATTGQKPGIQRSGGQNSFVGFDAHVTASYVDQLRQEVCRLRQLLVLQEAEHSRKIPAYESEEQSVAAENLHLRRMLQVEKERREMLSRQLSESESSLEMEDERHFNEACRGSRFRTISDSFSSQQPNPLYGPGYAYAAAVGSGWTRCQSCGQRLRVPNPDDAQTAFSANSSIGHGFASPRASGTRPCLCSPDKACTLHQTNLSASPSTPTTANRNVGFLKPSNRCSIHNSATAAIAFESPSMRLFTPEIAWHETLPIYSCDLQPQQLSGTVNNTDTSSSSRPPPLNDITFSDSVRATYPDSLQRPWTRLATAGGDNVVRLWRVYLDVSFSPKEIPTGSSKKVQLKNNAHLADHLIFAASLKRHEKPVNVVRWSPSATYLASAGDDLFIFIWAMQSSNLVNASQSSDAVCALGKEDDEEEATTSLEHWVPCRSLRRHLEDIYDVCWSPDSLALISGSVDHSVILWQLDLAPSSSNESTKQPTSNASNSTSDSSTPAPTTPSTGSGKTKCIILRDHKHYVQGVAWDPLGFYVASLSSDRACRIYRAGTRNCLAHVSKAGKQRLFQDDSWKSFFRRLSFSPDGLLLICPAGNLEDAPFAGSVAAAASIAASTIPTDGHNNTTPTTSSAPIPKASPQHAAHIFIRSNLTRPVVSLPTGPRPVVAVRFCPQPFQLRPVHQGPDSSRQVSSLFGLPYRWLFCLVLEDGVLLYDTQHMVPFAQVSQMHYQALNDVAWSEDGHLLFTCSTDGYCSFIHFMHGELGTRYRGPIGSKAIPDDLRTKKSVTSQKEQKPTEDYVKPPEPKVEQTTPHELVMLDKPSCSSSSGTVPTKNEVEKPEPTKKRRVALITLSNIEETTSVDPPPPYSTNNSSVTTESSENTMKNKPKRRVPFVTLTTDSPTSTIAIDSADPNVPSE